jgi:hypothetical protein
VLGFADAHRANPSAGICQIEVFSGQPINHRDISSFYAGLSATWDSGWCLFPKRLY